MHATYRNCLSALALAFLVLGARAEQAEAQGRGNRRGGDDAAAVTLSVEVKARITSFYESREPSGAEALPPGIRRNLERGKALPPGIAKKQPPPELRSRVTLPDGYELVEVGLDVFLVEVATQVIHDVLMDVVR